VLDCWFESGSMPYAQWGYPFQNREAFERGFPADFIAEGLDQTRGWFYTLTVIGAALFGKSPFRNVVVNGLVLAEDGKKMSKSLRNYPDPMEVLDRHGADALRLYLIQSPVVRAEELRFSEKGVTEIVRKILLRWWNAYSFFVSYANVDGFRPRGDASASPNILDQWLLSRLQALIENTQREMSAYRLYNVVPELLRFIEELTNTYIRFNRSHFWQERMPEDKRLAFETLYEALLRLAQVMAPFTPFLSETTYRNLACVSPAAARESVHLDAMPEPMPGLRRPDLEEAVAAMEALVMLGRNQREKIGVKAKIPLRTLRVIHRHRPVLENLRQFEPYFRDELNIREIIYDADEDRHVQITAKANFQALGPRLGNRMKAVAAGIQQLPLSDLLRLEAGVTVQVEGEPLGLADLEIRRAPRGQNPNLATHQLVSIELDPTVTPEQEREGLAREVLRKIQAARKNAGLELDNRIRLELSCTGSIREAVETHRQRIQAEALATEFVLVEGEPRGDHRETVALDEGPVAIGMARS